MCSPDENIKILEFLYRKNKTSVFYNRRLQDYLSDTFCFLRILGPFNFGSIFLERYILTAISMYIKSLYKGCYMLFSSFILLPLYSLFTNAIFSGTLKGRVGQEKIIKSAE